MNNIFGTAFEFDNQKKIINLRVDIRSGCNYFFNEMYFTSKCEQGNKTNAQS